MATTSTQAMAVARNATFQDRVFYCMTLAAANVMAELSTTTGHALRVTFAKSVLAGTANVFSYAAGALTNTTLFAEVNLAAPDFGIPDTDLQFAVNSLFSAYAGVSL